MKSLVIATAIFVVFSSTAMAQCGIASFYASDSKTASGEHFSPRGMTAAHRSLPFGTRLHVTNSKTKRSVDVRVNDRGPFVNGRVLDLSAGAARVLGMDGLAHVCF